MKKEIFLVDADDTVLDFHGASAKALIYAFSACGIAWKDEYASVYKRVNDGLWESLERKELTRAELIERRFPLYLSTLGFDGVDAEAFNQRYLHFLATNPIYMQGAEDFLRALNAIGRVFIVTNGTEKIVRSRFTIAKLWDFAEDVFISEVVGCDKPGKAYTDYVEAHIAGYEKEKTIWIGDSLSADIQAANSAGIESIWYNPHKKAAIGGAKPDYEAASFLEILKIIEKINA